MLGADAVTFIMLAGVLVFASHFFAWLFSYTKVPDALLLMVVGIILGPLLGLIPPDFFGGAGTVILTAALVIMLFDAGIRLELGSLRTAARGALALTVTSMVLAAAGIAGLLVWLTDVPWLMALLAGVIVSDATSSVVLALLPQLRLSERMQTLLTLEATLSDVLVLAGVLALVEAQATGSFAFSAFAGSVAAAIVGAVAIGFGVGVVWANLLDSVRHLQNSLFVTAAAVFVLHGVLELAGFSGFIAVLAFGVTLGSAGQFNHYLATHHRWLRYLFRPLTLSRRERAFFGELVFLLHTFFFVYLGLSMQFTGLAVFLLALAAVALFAVLRVLAVRISLPKDVSVRGAALAAAMIPKGLTSAVLALLLVQRGLPEAAFIQEFVAAIILWSIVATSLLVFLIERTAVGRLYQRLLAGFAPEPLLPKVPQARG